MRVCKRVHRGFQGFLVECERNGEILSLRLDLFDLGGDGFKALVFTHEIERLFDQLVEVVRRCDCFAGERLGSIAERDVDAQRLFAFFQRRQNGCLRFFLRHAADIHAVDGNALKHGGALQNRVELLPMQIGLGRYDRNLLRLRGTVRIDLFAGARIVIHLRVGSRSVACETQNQERRQKRQQPKYMFFVHRFVSFSVDAFILHAFFEKTILFEKHLLISYILGTSFIHPRGEMPRKASLIE